MYPNHSLLSVAVNGVELRTLGLGVEAVDGGWDAPDTTWAGADVPTRGGHALLAPSPTLAPRELVVRGVLRAASPADLETKLDRLRALCSGGPVEIVTVNRGARRRSGYFRGMAGGPVPPQFVNADAQVSLRFLCPDPRAFDVAPVVVSGPVSSRLPIPCGTADAAPVTIIHGAATDPELTLRDASGATLGSMVLTITLGANDAVVIDHRDFTLTRLTNGVLSDAVATEFEGDFFVVPPAGGDYLNALWPTIECSSGDCTVQLWRAWA